TLLAAIKQTVSKNTEVTFSPDAENLHGAEAVIVVVGEMPYAEMKGDRSDLSLAAGDAALIEKAKAAGVPVVTVLYSGRPLVLGKSLAASTAFVAAWLPGTEGAGVTDVLFGDFKPTGKLPRPWPHDNSELSSAAFAVPTAQPLFAPGFGLTYDAGTKPKEFKTAALNE
ncbi:MAG: hypothetical protein RL616_182, partial [Verrucomicrobiota bacterium]